MVVQARPVSTFVTGMETARKHETFALVRRTERSSARVGENRLC